MRITGTATMEITPAGKRMLAVDFGMVATPRTGDTQQMVDDIERAGWESPFTVELRRRQKIDTLVTEFANAWVDRIMDEMADEIMDRVLMSPPNFVGMKWE